jgi:hypothetical protein
MNKKTFCSRFERFFMKTYAICAPFEPIFMKKEAYCAHLGILFMNNSAVCQHSGGNRRQIGAHCRDDLSEK